MDKTGFVASNFDVSNGFVVIEAVKDLGVLALDEDAVRLSVPLLVGGLYVDEV